MNIDFRFSFGDKVLLLPLDRGPGRVVGTFIGERGVQYNVRYFSDGVPRTEYFFEDELAPPAQPQ
jgi:hypothetical protein